MWSPFCANTFGKNFNSNCISIQGLNRPRGAGLWGAASLFHQQQVISVIHKPVNDQFKSCIHIRFMLLPYQELTEHVPMNTLNTRYSHIPDLYHCQCWRNMYLRSTYDSYSWRNVYLRFTFQTCLQFASDNSLLLVPVTIHLGQICRVVQACRLRRALRKSVSRM